MIWANGGWLSFWAVGNIFHWNLNQNTTVAIEENEFEYVLSKMLAIVSVSSLNVLTSQSGQQPRLLPQVIPRTPLISNLAKTRLPLSYSTLAQTFAQWTAMMIYCRALYKKFKVIITMAGPWMLMQVCSTPICMVQCTHLITTGGAPHLYNRGSSMQVNSLHSGANNIYLHQ